MPVCFHHSSNQGDLPWWLDTEHLLYVSGFFCRCLWRCYCSEMHQRTGEELSSRTLLPRVPGPRQKSIFTLICWRCVPSSIVAYINMQGGTVSLSLYLLAGQVLAWAESSSACGLLHTATTEFGSGPQESSGSGHRHRVVSSSPSCSKYLSDMRRLR